MFSTLVVVISAIRFASAQITLTSSSCTDSPDMSYGFPTNYFTLGACQAHSCVNSTQPGLGIGSSSPYFSGNIKITCASSTNVTEVVKSLHGASKDWWAMEIYTDLNCTDVRGVVSTKSNFCYKFPYNFGVIYYSKVSLSANEATGAKYEIFTDDGCTGTVNTTTVLTSSQFSTSKCIVGTGTGPKDSTSSGDNIADLVPKGYSGRVYTWRNTIPKNATNASNNGTDASNNGTDTSGAFYGRSSLGVLVAVAVVAISL